MAKIYTKTGDQGETGLIGGKRVPKNNIRVEAYGTVDEANALLGLILARFQYCTHYEELQIIQNMLFEVGAILADPAARNTHPNEEDVAHLETLIDELSRELPPLTVFIMPGGCELASLFHVTRTTVRRAERRAVTVIQHDELPPVVVRYLNRLSDYLFTLARYANFEQGLKDTPWQKL